MIFFQSFFFQFFDFILIGRTDDLLTKELWSTWNPWQKIWDDTYGKYDDSDVDCKAKKVIMIFFHNNHLNDIHFCFYLLYSTEKEGYTPFLCKFI